MTNLRWHYVIYKITNLDTGRFYVGQHRTVNPNDSYMGSGSELNDDYSSYLKEGKSLKDHFKKEILFDFGSFQEMNEKEIEIVNEQFVNDPMTYNKTTGGSYQLKYPKGCIIIEYDSRKGSLREWSEWIGLSPDAIRQRLKKGMSMSEIIDMPPRERDRIWYAKTGEGHTIKDWCKKYGLKYDLVSRRLRLGWSIDRAIFENTSHEKTYMYMGKTFTLKELEDLTGIPKGTIRARITNYGWSVEKAVNTPLMPNPISIWKQKFKWNGGFYTIEQLAEISNGTLFRQTIHDRIKSGWTIDRIMQTPSKTIDTEHRKKRYEYNGKYITCEEGAELAGISVGWLKMKMKNGMSFQQAVDSKRKNRRGKLFYVGKTGKTIHEWSVSTGLDQSLLYRRLTK